MKRIFCPKCDHQITFDDTKYKDGDIIAFVCSLCGSQFKIRKGRRIVKNDLGDEKEIKETSFTCGSITVIENGFGFKQEFPLIMGNNVVGRRNKDTSGVDIPIITSDPSLGRKHCIINVSQNKQGEYVYTVQDFPSLTGTFLGNTLLGKKERARIEDGAIVTLGATTFILHTHNSEEPAT